MINPMQGILTQMSLLTAYSKYSTYIVKCYYDLSSQDLVIPVSAFWIRLVNQYKQIFVWIEEGAQDTAVELYYLIAIARLHV